MHTTYPKVSPTMRKLIPILITPVCLSLLGGCAPTWKMTKSTLKSSGYTSIAPFEWMIVQKGAVTVLSRHGTEIERIIIIRDPIGEAFPHTTYTTRPDMLPHELGELIYLRKRAIPGVFNVVVTRQSIEEVDGNPAIRVEMNYRSKGIPSTDIVYGFLESKFFYELRYSALQTHYFHESLDEFEDVVKHFKLR